MDEDNIIYEMFLDLTKKLNSDDLSRHVRMLSQSPRCAEDDEPTV